MLEPEIVKKQHLVDLFRQIAKAIEENDSFEGSVEYSCMDESCGPDEFSLQGVVRVGNLYGQGSTITFGKYVQDDKLDI